MKRFLFLLTFILGACATPPAAGNSIAPNVAAEAARQTRVASQAEEDFYNAQSTSTAAALTAVAYVPIMQMTQTAAEFSMQQTYAQATSTAAAQTQTAYAMQQAYIAQSTSTAGVATQVAAVTQQAFQVQVANDQLDLERAQITNRVKALLVYAFSFASLFVAVAYAFTLIKKAAFMPNPVDERGKPQPMIDVVDGTSWDIDRATNGMLGTGKAFLKQLPAITADRQNEVTARAQLVDMNTRARVPKRLIDSQGQNQLALPENEKPLLIDYPLPEWTHWMQNWKPGHIALGINEKGLLQADPDLHPHFLFAGTTGSWKTRGGMRVVVTCALASGWQVIIAGKQLDYKVFERHPNAHLVPFSLLKDPTRAVELLRAVYGEIERRDRMMSAGGHSLWSDTGQTRTMVVVDEFSNLADALEDIDSSRREELWRWARMDTAEARKYGMHMVYALQDPTAKSIDLRIRRNTTPIMFRVKDAASSRTLLNVGGAEMLSVRHFLASIARLERGAAFAPSDQEIQKFLNAHPVRTDPQSASAWIDGIVTDVPGTLNGDQQDALPSPATVASLVKTLTDQEARIIEMYQNGTSKSEIARELFGYGEGSAFNKVAAAIKKYTEAKNATTTTLPMPNLGTAAA